MCYYGHNLSMHHNLKDIRGEYKSAIIDSLSHGRKDFTSLQKSLDSVVSDLLNKTLSQMQDDDLVQSETFYDYPSRVEYFLTSRGYEYANLISYFDSVKHFESLFATLPD